MLLLKIYFAMEKINDCCTLLTVPNLVYGHLVTANTVCQIKISPLKSGLDPAATDASL